MGAQRYSFSSVGAGYELLSASWYLTEMSLRTRIERSIENVFKTCFPWDSPEAIGRRIYVFHIILSIWILVYWCIYMVAGTISPFGWVTLWGFCAMISLQFLIIKRCVLSSIEKRRLGYCFNPHIIYLKPLGLQRWLAPYLVVFYSSLMAAMFWRKSFVNLLRECFS